jgi:K(+)-stimulated pyrophosphate-energized sodium pump
MRKGGIFMINENNIILFLIVIIAVSLIALIYASILYNSIKKEEIHIPIVEEIAGFIHEGAMAFLKREYRIIIIFIIIVAVILGCLGLIPNLQKADGVGFGAAFSFLIGALCSGVAGFCGMMSATKANARVTQAANDKGMSKALKIAFSGGSVLGLCVVGFGLLGLTVIFTLFYVFTGSIEESAHVVTGYSLGCSLIALFARVGGGIYTKAADVGADLVGKIETGIPEDDPRNPAVIADNVGDNVGDIAGVGSDLCESYVGAIVSAISLGISTVASANSDLTISAVIFPLLIAAIGIASSMCAQVYVRLKEWENPSKALNIATYVSTFVVLIGSLILSYLTFNDVHPFLSILSGLIVGIIIGKIAEIYTSADYHSVKHIASQSQTGHATNIIAGLSVGMQSTASTILLLVAGIGASYLFYGMYGIALGAVGMLSTTGITVSVDGYGPIADNAGGIAEMSKMRTRVRDITDKLDSVGNTTAAVGKGFCIGSAAFTSLAMIVAYSKLANLDSISLLEPGVIIALLFGAMLPYLFSSITIASVGKAANQMIDEVRRQFRNDAKILQGKSKPDYAKCVDISTQAALKEMIIPGIIAVVSPIIVGVLLGTKGLGGMLIGALLSSIMLAVFMANSGGAWDNAKKYIEEGNYGGKSSGAHRASVTGDTVGDPFKDTAGPAMDILIKLMSVISMILAPVLIQMTPLLEFLFH